jgi:hypothetical protein
LIGSEIFLVSSCKKNGRNFCNSKNNPKTKLLKLEKSLFIFFYRGNHLYLCIS